MDNETLDRMVEAHDEALAEDGFLEFVRGEQPDPARHRRAMLAALRAMWSPAEEAPKDGSAILGHSPAYNGMMIFSINGEQHCWWSPGLGHMPHDHPLKPTHFAPLLPGPEE